MGELNTRMTIEDFVANLSSEYYNLIRQKIRLRNLRSSLGPFQGASTDRGGKVLYRLHVPSGLATGSSGLQLG